MSMTIKAIGANNNSPSFGMTKGEFGRFMDELAKEPYSVDLFKKGKMNVRQYANFISKNMVEPKTRRQKTTVQSLNATRIYP